VPRGHGVDGAQGWGEAIMWTVAADFLSQVRGRARSGHEMFMFCFDFRVKPGSGEEFSEVFDRWDHGRDNWFHRDSHQVQEGVLYRDDLDSDHFRLIGIWDSREAHRAAYDRFVREAPPWVDKYLDGGIDAFVPRYFSVAV
jgi:hypothetical protein